MYVLDLRVWDVGTHSTHQLIAGLLFFGSLLMVLFSVAQLLLFGKRNTNRNDTAMLEFEKTTILVTTGLYRYIRHPMYDSLFLLCWGLFFKQLSLVGGILAVIASSFLVATSRAEEAENLNYFGEEYREYMKRTKMFIPFIL